MLALRPGPVGHPIPCPLNVTMSPALPVKNPLISKEKVPSGLHVLIAAAVSQPSTPRAFLDLGTNSRPFRQAGPGCFGRLCPSHLDEFADYEGASPPAFVSDLPCFPKACCSIFPESGLVVSDSGLVFCRHLRVSVHLQGRKPRQPHSEGGIMVVSFVSFRTVVDQ